MKPTRKKTVRISNGAIEGFVKKNNAIAIKIMLYVATHQRNELNSELFEFTLDTREVCKVCNIDLKTLRQNIVQMTETSINFQYGEGRKKTNSYITVIPHATFDHNNNLVVKIFREIKELINDVKNKFTIIDVPQLMNLKSKQSIRMLEILEMINCFDYNIPKRKQYDLEELNGMFGTKYKKINDFEKAILKIAKEELDNNSNIGFEYSIKYDKNDNRAGRPSAKWIIIDLIKIKNLQPKLF